MKKIIIIGTFPNTKQKEDLLLDCVERLSNLGYDLMITSHFPIAKHIQEKVNYVVYDGENILEPFHLTPNFFLTYKNFRVDIKQNGHVIAVCRNINNGLSLAKQLNYNFFFYLEFDNLIDRNDTHLLNNLHYEMIVNSKKMIFFNHINEQSEIYESLIFAGTPEYFLEKIQLPNNLEDFENFGMSWTLEKTFFKKLSIHQSDFLIIKNSSKDFFKNSEINKIANFTFVDIISDKENGSYFLWLYNHSCNDKSVKFIVDEGNPFELGSGGWMMIPISMNQKINVMIEENGFRNLKEFHLTEESKDYFINKGTITKI